jgi:hypothetical protein
MSECVLVSESRVLVCIDRYAGQRAATSAMSESEPPMQHHKRTWVRHILPLYNMHKRIPQHANNKAERSEGNIIYWTLNLLTLVKSNQPGRKNDFFLHFGELMALKWSRCGALCKWLPSREASLNQAAPLFNRLFCKCAKTSNSKLTRGGLGFRRRK